MTADAATPASSQSGHARSARLAALARGLRAQAAGPEAFAFWMLVAGLVYAAATLTPSSYGLALKNFFGAGTPGLLFGTPHPPKLRQENDTHFLPDIVGGTVDEVVTDSAAGTVTVAGWALIDAGSVDPSLVIYAPDGTAEGPVSVIDRPDVAIALGDVGLQRAGFRLTLHMRSAAPLRELCLASLDPVRHTCFETLVH